MALGYAGVPAADSRPPIWSGWAWVRRMASILRTNAEPRQIGDKFAANAIGSAGAGIHQHRIPATADQIGANRNGLRRG